MIYPFTFESNSLNQLIYFEADNLNKSIALFNIYELTKKCDYSLYLITNLLNQTFTYNSDFGSIFKLFQSHKYVLYPNATLKFSFSGNQTEEVYFSVVPFLNTQAQFYTNIHILQGININGTILEQFITYAVGIMPQSYLIQSFELTIFNPSNQIIEVLFGVFDMKNLNNSNGDVVLRFLIFLYFLGIFLAIAGFIALIILGVYCLFWKKKKQQEATVEYQECDNQNKDLTVSQENAMYVQPNQADIKYV